MRSYFVYDKRKRLNIFGYFIILNGGRFSRVVSSIKYINNYIRLTLFIPSVAVAILVFSLSVRFKIAAL